MPFVYWFIITLSYSVPKWYIYKKVKEDKDNILPLSISVITIAIIASIVVTVMFKGSDIFFNTTTSSMVILPSLIACLFAPMKSNEQQEKQKQMDRINEALNKYSNVE